MFALAKEYDKLKFFNEDVLKFNLEKNTSQTFSVIGNFPYNISSQILFKLIEN